MGRRRSAVTPIPADFFRKERPARRVREIHNMLIISKSTQFSPDGLAVRGQCNPDSPGWQLRWFEKGEPLTVVWQGAFKTCRQLQVECANAASAEAASAMIAKSLDSGSFVRSVSTATDIYPAARNETPSPGQTGAPAQDDKKKRKRKRK